jgi:hypothetical protein
LTDVKKWLGQVQYIDRRIDAKCEQAMRIRARLEGRRARGGGVGMTYRGYTLTPVMRLLPSGARVEQIEMRSETRLTYADKLATAKRAVDTWEGKKVAQNAK